MLFNKVYDEQIRSSPRAREYEDLEQQYLVANDQRRVAAQAFADARNAGTDAAAGPAGEQFTRRRRSGPRGTRAAR